jgi:cysteine desulfurase
MIYLDYAATTPLHPQVRQGMLEVIDVWGNPSSVHAEGRRARNLLETARERVAAALQCKPRELIFTSGGSESDAMALLGVALARPPGHLISTQVEHSAVLKVLEALQNRGYTVTLLAPDAQGMIYPQQVAQALRPETFLVSVMTVNNELGNIYQVAQMAQVCHQAGVLFHTDAVQALGSVEATVAALQADLISIAAHKFYGPKGVGALYVRRGISLFPTIPGKQEQGLRGGTENLLGAWGMGMAAEIAVREGPAENQRLAGLRDTLQQQVLAVPGVGLNGHPVQRTARHLNVTVEEADGEALLLNLDLLGIAVSSGSACGSGSLEPSHVLRALGHSPDQARASVRFSLGAQTTADQIEQAARAFARAVEGARLG